MSMSIRAAILAAADQIETYPEFFNFMHSPVPPDCATPGCALGWIGHFADRGLRDHQSVAASLGLTPMEFYHKLNDLGVAGWTTDAKLCALGLRRYADAYHGDPGDFEVKGADDKTSTGA